MSQNTSSAVMQQRVEPHDSLDFFPTPLWATRALCELLGGKKALSKLTAWEPACGEGHMARPLAEYFSQVVASDVHPYGFGLVRDFLSSTPEYVNADWIITNPPFRLADAFIKTAKQHANIGIAVLVRTAFLEGVSRYEELFSQFPPNIIAQFCERVPMLKGRLVENASTATAYCWVIWNRSLAGTTFEWISKCRVRLERPGDYA